MITLRVVGLPAPQGSKVRMPNGVMLDGTSKTGRANLAAWRDAVRAACRARLDAHPAAPLDEPLHVAIHFTMPAPASDPHRLWHTGAPDLDKLVRGVFDSLKHGGLIRDDAIVCSLVTSKAYVQGDQPIGCEISIDPRGWQQAEHREQSKQRVADARRAAKAAS